MSKKDDHVVTFHATERPTGPHDLPDLRAHLLDKWRPGRTFDRVAETTRHFERPNQPITAFDASFDKRTLKEAALWWVDADAMEIVRSSAPSFSNDYALHLDDLTHKHGLAMFATPVLGLDAVNIGEQVRVDALLWGPATLPALPSMKTPEPRRVISMASYAWWSYDDGLSRTQMMSDAAVIQMNDDAERTRWLTKMNANTGIVMHGGFWVPLGRSDWVLGQPLHEVVEEVSRNEPSRAESMMEDRRLAATIWHLAKQPRVIHTRVETLTGPRRRSITRTGYSPDVNVMELRPAVHTTTGEGRVVNWQHRWIVKAHWRSQPCGPGRTLRKQTLVSPCIKGPAGLPFKAPKPTVWKLDGN